MTISLFDVQAGCHGLTPGSTTVFSSDDLAAEMARLEIESALVQIAPDTLDLDIILSQQMLLEICRSHPRMLPCPVIVPGDEGGYRADERAKVADLIARGAAAVTIRPALHCWSLAQWCCGGLLAALAERRLPVLCQTDRVSVEQAADLATRHPELRIILTKVDYSAARVLMPLLQEFSNVYLSIGSNYSYHKGIETTVSRLGPGRLLFGTGVPTAEPAMAVTQLMYAQISDADKRRIGSENLRDLIGGIKR
jgi:hypothetical protein